MGEVSYAHYVTVALCCNGPLFATRAFDFWISDEKRRFTDIIDCTSASDAATGSPARMTGHFVSMLSSPRPESDGQFMEDDQWLVNLAQNLALAVDEDIPCALEKIDELHVMGWSQSMVSAAVGSHRGIHPHHCRPHGKIFFAHSDNDLAPSFENAMGVAFDVAEDVIRTLNG